MRQQAGAVLATINCFGGIRYRQTSKFQADRRLLSGYVEGLLGKRKGDGEKVESPVQEVAIQSTTQLLLCQNQAQVKRKLKIHRVTQACPITA